MRNLVAIFLSFDNIVVCFAFVLRVLFKRVIHDKSQLLRTSRAGC